MSADRGPCPDPASDARIAFFRTLYVVQLRDRGVVTLPKDVRDRYGLAADTPLTLIDWDGILVLSSRVPVVTELARQLASERAAAGVTVDDLLTAWAQERYGTELPPSTDDA